MELERGAFLPVYSSALFGWKPIFFGRFFIFRDLSHLKFLRPFPKRVFCGFSLLDIFALFAARFFGFLLGFAFCSVFTCNLYFSWFSVVFL